MARFWALKPDGSLCTAECCKGEHGIYPVWLVREPERLLLRPQGKLNPNDVGWWQEAFHAIGAAPIKQPHGGWVVALEPTRLLTAIEELGRRGFYLVEYLEKPRPAPAISEGSHYIGKTAAQVRAELDAHN